MPTARPFAYYPGGSGGSNLIQGTLQVGNLAVGVTASGYNSGVGGVRWWNGPDESLGYVIAHEVPLGNQPFNPAIGATSAYVGFWRSENLTENSFVNLSNWVNLGVGGTGGFSNGSQAKIWLNSNGYWTSYGSIVQSGLTLQLDAGKSESYPGSGSTWYDLVSPQQNITLVNSPTYTSSSPSYFTFNSGSSQYGSGSGAVLSPTSYTKSVWFYLNSYVDNNILSSNTGGHYMFFQGGNKMYNGHSNWAGFPSNFPSTATFSLNTWYCATLTFNTTDGMKLYINGSLDSTYTTIKTAYTGNGSTNLACYSLGGNLLNGRISKVYCYDRSLSSDEVLQNYNSDKAQFGL